MSAPQPSQADEHDPGRQHGAGRGDGARPERDPARRGHRRRAGGRHRRRDARACRPSTAKSRVRSTPISEQAIIGAAIGAAIVGMRPVAEIMLMNFTTVAMDMIVNHAAKLRFMSGGQTHVPITIRTMTGAGFGTGGQHADYLEAWFAHTAGIKVVAPSIAGRRLWADAVLHLRRRPVPVHREHADVLDPGRRRRSLASASRSARRTCCAPASDVTVISYSRTVARLRRGRRQAGEGGHQRRADRPAHHLAVGRGDRARLGRRGRGAR